MIRKSAFFLDETEQMIIPLQVPSHPTPFFLRYRVSYFYEHLTGLENLQLHASYMGFHDKKRAAEVLEQVDLT